MCGGGWRCGKDRLLEGFKARGPRQMGHVETSFQTIAQHRVKCFKYNEAGEAVGLFASVY